ncbi:MAG TPA: hypothetical protein DEP84_18405 [Chloroflexi bacterium]|nr:hypothetical protein [Chloroflexota bacterium]
MAQLPSTGLVCGGKSKMDATSSVRVGSRPCGRMGRVALGMKRGRIAGGDPGPGTLPGGRFGPDAGPEANTGAQLPLLLVYATVLTQPESSLW